jgi:hypothetical protein
MFVYYFTIIGKKQKVLFHILVHARGYTKFVRIKIDIEIEWPYLSDFLAHHTVPRQAVYRSKKYRKINEKRHFIKIERFLRLFLRPINFSVLKTEKSIFLVRYGPKKKINGI